MTLAASTSRATLALSLLTVVAAARAPTVVEYLLPRPRAFPHDPAVGRDGAVWYTDQANSYIGRLDPTTGKVTDYPTPTPASGPHGIAVAPNAWSGGETTGSPARPPATWP